MLDHSFIDVYISHFMYFLPCHAEVEHIVAKPEVPHIKYVLYCFLRYEDIVCEMLSDGEGSPDARKTAARQKRYQELSQEPRAVYTVGHTQKMMQKEKATSKKKIGVGILHSFLKTFSFWENT